MNTNDSIIAWVDESGSSSEHDPGTYILAAAITAGPVDDIRNTMRALRLRGQIKLHWRDERPSRKLRITDTLASINIEHLVVVTTQHHAQVSLERRRRLTLQLLLPELAALGVGQVYFESRGESDDKRDRKMLNFLRQQRLVDATLRIDHVGGGDEPLLWIPDAVCGMVSARRSGDPAYYDKLAARIKLDEHSTGQ